MFLTLLQSQGSPAPPTPSLGGGGGGGGYYPRRKWAKRLDQIVSEWVDADAKEMYREIVAEAPKEIKAQAAKIVRPYTKATRPIPKPQSVDWEALNAEADRVQALFRLWREEIDHQEDEEELIFLTIH